MKHSDNCIITKVIQLSLYEQNCNATVVSFSQIIKITKNRDMGWSEYKTQFLFGFGRRREHMKKKEPVSFGPHMWMNGNLEDEWEVGMYKINKTISLIYQ